MMQIQCRAVTFCCFALVLSTVVIRNSNFNGSKYQFSLQFLTRGAAREQQRAARELLEKRKRQQLTSNNLSRIPLFVSLKRLQNDIEWLHIPKTGTSFGNLLVNWACPDLEKKVWVRESGVSRDLPAYCLARFKTFPGLSRPKLPIGDHWTLEGRTNEQLRTVFTMVRNPKTRLASGYHFRTRYQQLDATPEEMCSLINNSTYAHSSRGAQVKIILGTHEFVDRHFHFETPQPPSLREAHEACNRLQRFAFIGITDFWNATVCLFHGEFGGQSHPSELVNVRSGSRFHKRRPPVSEVDCDDAADEVLYKCALDLFEKRLEKHSQCRQHLTNSD